MELYDYYRLCEDVPDEEELDLARQMAEESAWDDAAQSLEGEKEKL